MTGLPAAFSALALASTASVADSEIAEMRAETLVAMGLMLVPTPAERPGRINCRWVLVPAIAGGRFDSAAEQTYTAWTGSPAVAAAACP